MKNKYIKRTHVSERKFKEIIKHFSADVPSLTTSELINLNKNTIHQIYNKLRERLAELSLEENEPFHGEIEVDESYFGAKRIRGKRGRGARGKIPVVGVLKRGGKVYTKVVENCSRQQIMPILKGKILEESTVYTDGWKSYHGLIYQGFQHYRIYHSKNEFARGKNHINGIKSFWGFTKTRMQKLRGIRKEKFMIHLKKSEWRWNHRNENIYKILLKILAKKPLN
ncbi:IS1595 family transposase [Candidatus Roizmanbacteria bacterium CG11_big_fil_rev_8_21_14_0_20_36_8]|uniref:IS1595 family transposase n=1 Tax=Candidatus Roizmanbacteria bacterium CG11_big_fil_rev_8_21_14_0_20_36_8 TaxID=1974856 RepID=A0A2M6ITX7_9BACT|nr:MAG: IS1595 family transposase [Candidatus Roizmanbacteria bacterium CG11_big_fil_rev_8_21_14_0_20_36_8]PIR63484.1 MAG: IS1595 family transposase [Candidatus Pacebacteria bacterium CG10_big_fil_rev_8_21_14_0_10_40_26]